MSRIRGRDTKPEMLVRRGLHARGLRFRLHDRKLPGKPDLVFPRFRSVLFVHGCFWHGHGCHLFRWPSTRKEFWREKIEANYRRDRKAARQLKEAGWRVMWVWECSLRGKHRRNLANVLDEIEQWIHGNGTFGELRGFDDGNS